MAWKFNWWSCSAQKVANSEASRCLRHLKCRSTSSFSPPRQILNHVEKTYCQKISNHKPWSTSPPALSPSLSLPALVSASTSIFSFAFFAKIRLWHSAESGKSSRKKVAVLLDFVQMRRGRPCLQTKSPSEEREREDLSKLFNFWPSRAKSSDSSFNVPLFTWICLNGKVSSFWIHLNVRQHTKNKRCNKIHFWSEGTCSPALSSEAPSTFVVDNIGNFWAVLCYTIRFTAKLQH